MTALRTIWGVDFSVIESRFGTEFLIYIKNQLPAISAPLIEPTENGFKLSAKGMNVADTVISECFFIEN